MLQPATIDSGGALGTALSNIRKLAERLICPSEDMVYAPDRRDLKRLPIAKLPELLLHLSPSLQGLLPNLSPSCLDPHEHKDMVRISGIQ